MVMRWNNFSVRLSGFSMVRNNFMMRFCDPRVPESDSPVRLSDISMRFSHFFMR